MVHITKHVYRASENTLDINKFLLIRVLRENPSQCAVFAANLGKAPITPVNVLNCIANSLGANGGWIIDFIVSVKGFFLNEKFIRMTKFEGGCEFSFKGSTFLVDSMPDKL